MTPSSHSPRLMLILTIIGLIVMLLIVTPSASGQLGATIQPPERLSSTAPGWDSNPCIASDRNGTWLAVWSFGDQIPDDLDFYFPHDIVCRVRTGDAWGPIIPVNNDNRTYYDQYPRAAGDGHGVWVVVWQTAPRDPPDIGSDDLDIVFSRSDDNGETWSAPAFLNPPHSGYVWDMTPDIATDGRGRWIVVWDYDPDPDASRIHYVVSDDNGLTWSDHAPVITAGHPGEEFRPRLATDGHGRWVVAWLELDDNAPVMSSDYDIYCSVMNDGHGWGERRALSLDASSDQANDLYHSIDCDGQETWAVVWCSNEIGRRRANIVVTRSRDGAMTWNDPEKIHPQAVTTTEDTWSTAVRCDRVAGNARWLAAWYSRHDPDGTLGGEGDLLASTAGRCLDDWSAPEPLNSTAGADPAESHEQFPALASDEAGTWYVIWNNDPGPELFSNVEAARIILPDCNANGIPDVEDIAAGTTHDCLLADPPDCDEPGPGLDEGPCGCGMLAWLGASLPALVFRRTGLVPWRPAPRSGPGSLHGR